MKREEALKVLDIDESKDLITPELIQNNFKRFYDMNEPENGGSFYLQSKIYNAKEALMHQN